MYPKFVAERKLREIIEQNIGSVQYIIDILEITPKSRGWFQGLPPEDKYRFKIFVRDIHRDIKEDGNFGGLKYRPISNNPFKQKESERWELVIRNILQDYTGESMIDTPKRRLLVPGKSHPKTSI